MATIHEDPDHHVALLVDSGAFTAWTRAEEIDIDEYAAFLRQHACLIWGYVNLDAIPGRYGVARSSADTEAAAARSHANLKALQQRGLHPIPVFHQGESMDWLDRMVEEGEDYIGISPGDDAPLAEQLAFMDRCFTRLTDAQGRPYVKTHGFGLMNYRSLLRYPWYSADSAAWVLLPGFGNLYVPGKAADGGFDYIARTNISFSGRQRRSSLKSGYTMQRSMRRWTDLGEAQRAHVLRFFDEVCGGLSLPEVVNSQEARRLAMLRFTQGFVAQRGDDVRFTHQVEDLFEPRPQLFSGAAMPRLQMRAFMATYGDTARNRVLNRATHRERLISYYFVRQDSAAAIERYVLTGGAPPNAQARRPKANWKETYKTFRRLKLLETVRRGDVDG